MPTTTAEGATHGRAAPGTEGRWPDGFLEGVDRHSWLLVALFSVVAAALADWRDLPADYLLFVRSGSSLLTGHLTRVFSDPSVQTGPLTAALFGTWHACMGALRLPEAPATVLALCSLNTVALIVCARRVVGPGPARGGSTLAAGVLALLFGTLSIDDAHPTHALIAMLWFFAARSARKQDVRCGLLIGLAAGLDSWGVLGVGVLLVDLRTSRRSLALASAVALLLWAPFVLAGRFHSGQMQWMPVPGSLPALLLGHHPVPWGYRLVQGGLVLLLGCALALLLDKSPNLDWLLPAALIAARIATDPLHYRYYDMPLVILLLVGVVGLLAHPLADRELEPEGTPRWPRALFLILIPALLLPPLLTFAGPLIAETPPLACLAALAWCAWRLQPTRHRRGDAPAPRDAKLRLPIP